MHPLIADLVKITTNIDKTPKDKYDALFASIVGKLVTIAVAQDERIEQLEKQLRTKNNGKH